MSLSVEDESEQVVPPDKLAPLNDRQQVMFVSKYVKFIDYLESEGKNPSKGEGYPEKSVTERKSRLLKAFNWIWENEEVTTEITPAHGDRIIDALNEDEFCREDGEPYTGDSKRKIGDVLQNWFEWQGFDWEPEISFKSTRTEEQADPFHKDELRLICQASLEYKTVPSYNNLSPEERDRWKAHIAQELSKPKEDVTPDDWERLNTFWKIPSLIYTTRPNGWRPALVERLSVEWYDEDEKAIEIPADQAVKNDQPWTQYLSDKGVEALEHWLEQRENIEKYDGRSEIWLNREGNPYDSSTLNSLLDDLIDEAGIERRGRKLVWYSFRHSIGTYVYEEYKDLEPVAERLRHVSKESASRYVHPTEEMMREAANIM